MSKGIFDDGEKVDKIVFRPLDIDMAAKVKKVSDPAPRPLPMPLDDESKATDWIPGVKRTKKKKETDPNKKSLDIVAVGSIFKWAIFTGITLASLAGIAMVVIWVSQQYNIGG